MALIRLVKVLQVICAVSIIVPVFVIAEEEQQCLENDENCKAPANATDDSNDNSECRLYLGESSIPNSGLGMYTTVDLTANKIVGWPDLFIKVVQSRDTGILLDYYWNSWHWMPEGNRADSLDAGFGMAANSHLGLLSVSQRNDLMKVDDAGLHRHLSPGAGAITQYHNLEWHMDKDIEAGSELFVDYGGGYFLGREETMGVIPLHEHFAFADKLSKKMDDYFDVYKWTLTDELKGAIWDSVHSHIVDDKRNRIALPKSVHDLKEAARKGVANLSMPNRVRSKEWLKENAMCMDNLKPGNSTVSDAGRGAFASRFIPEGELIAPSPLVHISDDVLQMNAATRDEKHRGIVLNKNITLGHELILNYCFGHPKSSLRFFPYASWMYYVNHSPQPKQANAKLRWSTAKSQKAHWLEYSAEKVLEEPHAGLILDLVATRDIQQDEEVFIDYGMEWQMSWDEHKQKWSNTAAAKEKNYVSAAAFSKTDPVRTVLEQQQNPYPDNVMTACYVVYDKEDGKETETETSSGQRTLRGEDIQIFDEEIVLESAYIWDEHDASSIESGYKPCQVISREITEEGEELYFVLVVSPAGDSYKVVKEVERKGIRLIDKPYSTDPFIPDAFRHFIGIPDNIFPESWMDKDSAKNTEDT
jgi:hypothetical protein